MGPSSSPWRRKYERDTVRELRLVVEIESQFCVNVETSCLEPRLKGTTVRAEPRLPKRWEIL